jgi:hypothetical protein
LKMLHKMSLDRKETVFLEMFFPNILELAL